MGSIPDKEIPGPARAGRKHRAPGIIIAVLGALCLLYLLLLIPDGQPPVDPPGTAGAQEGPFAWNQDAYWEVLEGAFRQARESDCSTAEREVASRLRKARQFLQRLEGRQLGPDSPEFAEIERSMFETASTVAACGAGLSEYLRFVSEMRGAVKRQSEGWDMDAEVSKTTLYRLLYGARGAIEEIMIQAPPGSVPPLLAGTDEPSTAPSAETRSVRIHSGDILLSRGGAPTSALIARGNDYPGNFSHVALVYVDPASREARIIESHIEKGVAVSTVREYLEDKKLRVMVLRLRSDLPQVRDEPMMAHKAAEYAYRTASAGHIPYDFEMDYKDHRKLFCSEVASAAYERFGIRLWAGISRISSPGLRRWLRAFGVRHFETQEPSDLEYDPQLRVVAEWRDPETLRKDRFDNAATEVMLEGAEKGEEITYPWYLLPVARLLKACSVALNLFNVVGPVPEGMTATTALRTMGYEEAHRAIAGRLAGRAGDFRRERGYEPPYWELVRLAREAKKDRKLSGLYHPSPS